MTNERKRKTENGKRKEKKQKLLVDVIIRKRL
jgi:hypothetical protein